MENISAHAHTDECRRRDRITAQKLDVGLVFYQMLGFDDAMQYLAMNNIPKALGMRVLTLAEHRRPDGDCWGEDRRKPVSHN